MPIDYKDYPENWREISRRIRFERAKNVCEWCEAINGEAHPVTGSKVVLTVAHLGVSRLNGMAGDKHDKHDCRDENLAALCQRCHLAFDHDDHIQQARETRERRRCEREPFLSEMFHLSVFQPQKL